MKAVIFLEREWKNLWSRIVQDQGPAVNISWVCKERLGFTVRRHRLPISDDGHYWEHQEQIHLDFYDENMRTWFVLKYMNNECNID